jgi:hypothetical protein
VAVLGRRATQRVFFAHEWSVVSKRGYLASQKGDPLQRRRHAIFLQGLGNYFGNTGSMSLNLFPEIDLLSCPVCFRRAISELDCFELSGCGILGMSPVLQSPRG